MNIFILDKNPTLCAQYHCDKHIVKMATEYAQILSTVHWLRQSRLSIDLPDILYKPTHQNHPCVQWAMNFRNYFWLWHLYEAVGNEYFKRYGKRHKALMGTTASDPNEVSRYHYLFELPYKPDEHIPDYENPFIPRILISEDVPEWVTSPALCIGKSPKIIGKDCDGVPEFDVVESYRNYYIREKLRFARWNHGPMPAWILKRNK